MEIKVISKEKDYMEIELVGADETLLSPLAARLLEDDTVTEAKYSLGFNPADTPRLIIRTKEGKPQTALKKAVKKLSSEFEGAKKAFAKASK
jgi:DNA-directed RNA polymerase subunit L